MKELNLSNTLSWSRIVLAPLVYYAGFARELELFILLFALGGLTDALDGPIARHFKQVTKYGAQLDSMADCIFYPAGLLLYFFVPEAIINNVAWIIIGVGIFALGVIIALFRGKFVFPHLVSAKIFAVIVYFFVLYTLVFEYSTFFINITIAIGIWAALEQFILFSFGNPKSSQRWIWQ